MDIFLWIRTIFCTLHLLMGTSFLWKAKAVPKRYLLFFRKPTKKVKQTKKTCSKNKKLIPSKTKKLITDNF